MGLACAYLRPTRCHCGLQCFSASLAQLAEHALCERMVMGSASRACSASEARLARQRGQCARMFCWQRPLGDDGTICLFGHAYCVRECAVACANIAAEYRASCCACRTLGQSPVKIARMTLTIKLDRNWSSFQLANSAPPLSVTDSAIAPSARMAATVLFRLWQKTKL